jgi:2,5-diketo-D-gluconate reductase A
MFRSTLAVAFVAVAAATNVPTLEISEGIFMPLSGLGTWQYNDTTCYNACLTALKMGYTHIDTALGYLNQEAVGKAIVDSGRARDTFFLTSKVPGGTNASTTQANLDLAMEQLGVDYVDLMLTHFPLPGPARAARR